MAIKALVRISDSILCGFAIDNDFDGDTYNGIEIIETQRDELILEMMNKNLIWDGNQFVESELFFDKKAKKQRQLMIVYVSKYNLRINGEQCSFSEDEIYKAYLKSEILTGSSCETNGSKILIASATTMVQFKIEVPEIKSALKSILCFKNTLDNTLSTKQSEIDLIPDEPTLDAYDLNAGWPENDLIISIDPLKIEIIYTNNI